MRLFKTRNICEEDKLSANVETLWASRSKSQFERRNTHAQCLCLARARTLTICNSIVGVVSCGRKTKVRKSVQRAKFSCSKLCEVAD